MAKYNTIKIGSVVKVNKKTLIVKKSEFEHGCRGTCEMCYMNIHGLYCDDFRKEIGECSANKRTDKVDIYFEYKEK